jgi:hypothetical protein
MPNHVTEQLIITLPVCSVYSQQHGDEKSLIITSEKRYETPSSTKKTFEESAKELQLTDRNQ